MDEDLRRRVDGSGANLESIVTGARRNAYRPQPLFMLEESGRSKGVRVWLE
jgi:hypothetical protein